MSLNKLRDEAHAIATEHGFTDATPAEDIALMHSELSEALEDIRSGRPLARLYAQKSPPSCDYVCKPEPMEVFGEFPPGWKPCGVPSELADVIIRICHFAGKHSIDLDEAVRLKMAYNRTRPFKHGKVL